MNVGIISTGAITTWFLKCYQDENSCYAMYSRTNKSADALRKQYYGEYEDTDLEMLFADEKIDAMYIASLNSLHFSHAKMASFVNKYAIFKKIFTSTLNECVELVQLAKERQLFLMEGITVMAVANMSKVSSKYYAHLKGEKPDVFQIAFSGGELRDLNVYNLHFIISFFDIPDYNRAIKKEGIDMSGCILLTYLDHMAICIALKDRDFHYYYLRKFIKIIQTSNYKKQDCRLIHIRDIIQVRKEVGILFEAYL